MIGHFSRWTCWTAVLCVSCVATCVGQESAGQADFDKAFDKKTAATSVAQFGEVIDLLKSALDKGLDEDNHEFAEQMLVATLIQRGTRISVSIFNLDVRNVQQVKRFPEYRALALADLESAVGIDENQPQAHLTIGRLHALPGGITYKAEEALEKAIALAGDETEIAVDAYITRAEMQQDEAKRLEHYATAIELRPDRPQGYRSRGMYLIGKGQTEEGLADLAKAVETDPGDLGTLKALTVALARAEQLDKALASATQLVEASEKPTEALLLRSRIFAAQENFESALADADQVIADEEDNMTAILSRVEYLGRLDRQDEALAEISAEIEKTPGALALVRTRGFIHLQMENVAKALEDFELVRDRVPTNLLARVQLATVYNGNQEFAKAVKEFDAALQIDAESVLAYQGRADARLHLGEQAGARDDYESALRLNKDNGSALNNLAWLLSTSPDEAIRNGDRAVELATDACELTNYERPHILSTLAAAYAELGDFENALKWSEKAVESAPDTTEEELATKEQLKREFASYQAGKPWREAAPGEGQEASE